MDISKLKFFDAGDSLMMSRVQETFKGFQVLHGGEYESSSFAYCALLLILSSTEHLVKPDFVSLMMRIRKFRKLFYLC